MKTPQPVTPDPLVTLCHHRWAVPILALCAGLPGAGAKFATLASRLGLSRPTLTRTLQALIEQGLLARAVGVQHPLRPEYVLTKPGLPVAAACRAALHELRQLQAEEVGLNKWTLPVLAALAAQRRKAARFGQVQTALPEATARALAMALRDAQVADLITREVLDTYPPAAEYRVGPRAVRLAAAAHRLAAECGPRPVSNGSAEPGSFRLKKTA